MKSKLLLIINFFLITALLWLAYLAITIYREHGLTEDLIGIMAGFVMILFVLGFTVVISMLRPCIKREEEEEAKGKTLYPDQPWMWKKEWVEKRITYEVPGAGAVFFLVFCVVLEFVLTGGYRCHD